MKKHLVIVLFLMAGLLTSLFAQQEQHKKKTAEQRTDMVTEKMTTELALTKQQQTQVHDLILKREKMRDAGTMPKDSREQIVADINKVLTPDQQKKWEQMRKEAREKHEHQQQQQQQQGKNSQSKPKNETSSGSDVY